MNCNGMNKQGTMHLSPEEIIRWQPYQRSVHFGNPKGHMIRRLEDVGLWTPNQIAGRRWSIGCVSLEITQRCNLDCTLCYLSEHSEAVRDVPMIDIFQRIDRIEAHYGPNTDVQISGGDPTLRNREELVAIVRRIVEKGMRPSLFTNGILAKRDLLCELADAGLTDVAFHVDMTQQRKGYRNEIELNAVRAEYIERTRGLPLAVFFNTTVFDGNFQDIPAVVGFFRRHADVVSVVSFQLQADTGRGILREREQELTTETLIESIQSGAGATLSFDTLKVGHPDCNRYAMALSINGNLYDCYDDPGITVSLLHATEDLVFSRTDRRAALRTAWQRLIANRTLWSQSGKWLLRLLWKAKSDLWRASGRVDKLTFVIHNFMDACRLEHDRLHACVFMVATADGPISMCLHNAKRDEFILKPLPVEKDGRSHLWNPLTGTLHDRLGMPAKPADPVFYPIKLLKGRTRAEALKIKDGNKAMTSGQLDPATQSIEETQ